MRKATILIMLLTGFLFTHSSQATQNYWFVLSTTCANCNENGFSDYSKPNKRLFISNVISAKKYDHACTYGAFYNKKGLNPEQNTGKSGLRTENEAKKYRRELLARASRDGYAIHNIHLEKYCDSK